MSFGGGEAGEGGGDEHSECATRAKISRNAEIQRRTCVVTAMNLVVSSLRLPE